MRAMTAAARDRTGVLIIRLWREDVPPNGIRARIIKSMDITSEEPVTSTAADLEGISRAVRDWLDAFVALGSTN